MERTNVWAKRAHSRDTRDSRDMKSEKYFVRVLRIIINIFILFRVIAY